jgi:hypothetical protein
MAISFDYFVCPFLIFFFFNSMQHSTYELHKVTSMCSNNFILRMQIFPLRNPMINCPGIPTVPLELLDLYCEKPVYHGKMLIKFTIFVI